MSTEQYIETLARLKPGELGLLRTHAGKSLDTTVHGFDLFTGLWWPLREKDQKAPRREVAWLIAKLYAIHPIPHSRNDYLAQQLGRCKPNAVQDRERYMERFDRMLVLPLSQIELSLQWALDWIAENSLCLDWVKLTDDLSIWELESTRLRWTEQFLQI